MATTNLFSRPVFREGAFTANDPAVRRYAVAKTFDAIDLGAELGAQVYVMWGGREGLEAEAAKYVRRRARPLRGGGRPLLRLHPRAGLRPRFALEPKPNEPRGDMFLPDGRPRAGVHQRARVARDGGPQPGVRPRDDVRPELHPRRSPDAVARQALPHRPQRAAHRQVRPGLPLRVRRHPRRLLPGEAARGRGLAGHAPLRRPRLPHRGRRTGCGTSPRAACAPTSSWPRRRPRFREDAEIQAALAGGQGRRAGRAHVARRARAETPSTPSRPVRTTSTRLAAQGYGHERLDQLVTELLLGVR